MLIEVDPIYLREINKKSVKVNTSIPGWLKAAAERSGVNISQVLQNALKEELQIKA
jgi:post-segregation antitoxin (ccd killing protein)